MLQLDEPFGMLDSLTRSELQAVLLELGRKNRITALSSGAEFSNGSEGMECVRRDGSGYSTILGTTNNPPAWAGALRMASSCGNGEVTTSDRVTLISGNA